MAGVPEASVRRGRPVAQAAKSKFDGNFDVTALGYTVRQIPTVMTSDTDDFSSGLKRPSKLSQLRQMRLTGVKFWYA